jgi:hypothetical protein
MQDVFPHAVEPLDTERICLQPLLEVLRAPAECENGRLNGDALDEPLYGATGRLLLFALEDIRRLWSLRR